MSDESVTEGQETETEETTETEDAGSHLTLQSVNDKLDDLADKISNFLKGGSRASKADDADAVGQQVKDEVAKLKAAEDAKKRASAREGTLADLQAKVAKLTEKAPVEYRKITQYLWGDPDA